MTPDTRVWSQRGGAAGVRQAKVEIQGGSHTQEWIVPLRVLIFLKKGNIKSTDEKFHIEG